jgi:hypothetical protein
MAQNNKPKVERPDAYDEKTVAELKARLMKLFDEQKKGFDAYMKKLARDANEIYGQTRDTLKEVKDVSNDAKRMLRDGKRYFIATAILSSIAIIISIASLIAK